jgi:2-haloacid dehalogenase
MIIPLPNRSPRRGEVRIEAVLFDTFGTVCDFYHPMKRAFEVLARRMGVECDAGRMAIDWRTAYVVSTFTQAVNESAFRPLRDINRENLVGVLETLFPIPLEASAIDVLNRTWEQLDPWPDAVEGLQAIKKLAIIAPLSNGNFADMVRLSRYGGLPWDIILGSSISGFYKPHPRTYLAYAAGHGMQTAFVIRRDEFGGPVKPKHPEPGINYMDAAEIHPEGDWTYLADDFLDLARQLKKDY